MPLGRRTDYGEARYVGAELGDSVDVERDLDAARLGGFDFVVAPLALPRDASLPAAQLRPPLPRAEFLLSSTAWSNQVVGRISAWIAPDSLDATLRADSEAALRSELAWAAHLSLQAVIVPAPAGPCANYARVTHSVLTSLSHTAVWLRVPLVAPAVSAVEGTPEEEALLAQTEPSTRARTHDPWEWWHAFRAACDGHASLGAVIDIGPTLPPAEQWQRWLGEPLRAAVLSTDAFLTNKRGFPVLPRRHQELVAALLGAGVQLLLRGERRHAPADAAAAGSADDVADGGDGAAAAAAAAAAPGDASTSHPLHLYREYLCYLFGKLPEVTEQERLEAGYRDYLQAPLQPLMDNLESQTYEVFEKDDTKYNTYEEAVFRALLDRPPPTPAEAAAPGGAAVVVMVVGAGRGPLVRAALRAGERAARPIRVYAVEKNPNAVVHLHALHASLRWGGRVIIVAHDMRTWAAPEAAHIMVSELLGSFGDNELSPECLDGAQRFLAPDGVSIPQSYVSYLAPVTASKLHNDVKAYNDLAHFETPYVVKLHRVALLAPALPVFTFRHPNHDAPIDNNRYEALRFERGPEAPGACLHGFAGYFDATLYADVHLSIYPPTHTPNMFSWFPIYFPLRQPVHVPAGAAVEAHVWRCGNGAKVWYEWATTAPQASPVHNPNGRSYFVGL